MSAWVDQNRALNSGDRKAILAAKPPIPPETCPIVDQVSERWSAIDGDLERIREEMSLCDKRATKTDLLGRITEWEEELLDASASIAGLRLKLEELRIANDQLRKSSWYWRRAFDKDTQNA